MGDAPEEIHSLLGGEPEVTKENLRTVHASTETWRQRWKRKQQAEEVLKYIPELWDVEAVSTASTTGPAPPPPVIASPPNFSVKTVSDFPLIGRKTLHNRLLMDAGFFSGAWTDLAMCFQQGLSHGGLQLFPLKFRIKELEEHFRRFCLRQAAVRWAPITSIHAAGFALLVLTLIETADARGWYSSLCILPLLLASACSTALALFSRRRNVLKAVELEEMRSDAASEVACNHWCDIIEETLPVWSILFLTSYVEALSGYKGEEPWMKVARAYVIAAICVAGGLSTARVSVTLVPWIATFACSLLALQGNGSPIVAIGVATSFITKYVLEFQLRAERLDLAEHYIEKAKRPAPMTKGENVLDLLEDIRAGIIGRADCVALAERVDEICDILRDGESFYREIPAAESDEAKEPLPAPAATTPRAETEELSSRRPSSSDSLSDSEVRLAYGGQPTSSRRASAAMQAAVAREQEVERHVADTGLDEPGLRAGMEWTLKHPDFCAQLGRTMSLNLLQLYDSPVQFPLATIGPLVLKPFSDAAGVKPVVLSKFLLRLDKTYLDNSYHNSNHGLAVGHQALVLMRDVALDPLCSPNVISWGAIEAMMFLVACFGHDAGHPGRTAAFVNGLIDPLCVIFPDSPLEYMHSAILLAGLDDPCTNILEGFSDTDKLVLRKRVTETILSTDMSRNRSFIARFKIAFTTMDPQYCTNDAWLLASMIIKLADIGHIILPFEQHVEWSNRVVEEMYLQTAEEEHWGTISTIPFFKREIHGTNFAETQYGFLKTLACPVAETFLRAFPQNRKLKSYLEIYQRHVKVWEEELTLLKTGAKAGQRRYTLPNYPSTSASTFRRNKCAEPLVKELAVLARRHRELGRNHLDFPMTLLQDIDSIQRPPVSPQPVVEDSHKPALSRIRDAKRRPAAYFTQLTVMPDSSGRPSYEDEEAKGPYTYVAEHEWIKQKFDSTRADEISTSAGLGTHRPEFSDLR